MMVLPWLRFIVKRLLGFAVLLLIITFLVFSLMYLAPGNLVDVILGTAEKTPGQVAAIRAQYNLDKPFIVQYALWLGNALKLQFGNSIMLNQSVTSALASRMGVTLFYGVYGFGIAVVSGMILGTTAALKNRSGLDRGIIGAVVFGVSIPAFASGLILLWAFSITLGWFPVIGAGSSDFGDRFWHLTLPAVTLGITGAALMAKLTRAALNTIYEQDYIGFARSRGISEIRILFRYGLRNALVPIITAAGLVITVTLTGSILIEETFSLKGVGDLVINAMENKDMPIVQAAVVYVALLVMVINLLIDIAYMVVDPRIRLSEGES